MGSVEVDALGPARCEHARMAVLETAVAVRHNSTDDVVDVVLAILRDAGHQGQLHLADAEHQKYSRDDVCIGAQANGWVTVHPHYVVPADGLAIALTSRLGTVSSATSIYEDVFWTHDLVSHGLVLDRYVNLPGYFGSGEYGSDYKGDPGLVADTLGVDATSIARYFRQISMLRARLGFLRPPKAYSSDTFDLLDGWVITDLWRRLGIAWGADHPAARLPVGDRGTTALTEHLRRIRSA